MEKVKTVAIPNGVSKEVGCTKDGHRIYHIIIKIKEDDEYRHYLDCPSSPSLLGKMAHIEKQTAKKIPSDILNKKIQQFKKTLLVSERELDNKKGLH